LDKNDYLKPEKKQIVLLPFLNLINLCQSPKMSFLASESSGYKGTHNVERKFFASNARAQAKHVAVVMFA
jgi:hypothetical protein